MRDQISIAVIGLGYVGLPLAVEFAAKYPVYGFDIKTARVAELKSSYDNTLEIEENKLKKVLNDPGSKNFESGLRLTSSLEDIKDCTVYIVTVPTPINHFNAPDLAPLLKASESIGKVLKKGDIVIYESTVYPGCTEDDCVPLLEKASGLQFNKDFFVGYSPERINPGDKEHTVTHILKVTSGSSPDAAEKIDQLYKSIIQAGTHKAPSIKVAEAAKVIENSQRDINIAFVNELAKIFNKLGIDTNEVLEAAATKWNFMKFKPGLVGGHCIGVDPYYLAQKAQEVGYHPEIILAGRRLNDGMGAYIAQEAIKLMLKRELKVKGAKVLVLGITFKENCPDVRNTRVVDIIKELTSYETKVDIVDPWADAKAVKAEYQLEIMKEVPDKRYDAIILAVAHQQFSALDFLNYKNDKGIIYDVKGLLDKSMVQGRL